MNRTRANIVNELKNIYNENIEVLKKLSVINAYCKLQSHSEAIFNIATLLIELEKETDKICESLANIISSNKEKEKSFTDYIQIVDRNDPRYIDD